MPSPLLLPAGNIVLLFFLPPQLVEDDLLRKYFRKVSEVFLPTPFAWRATGQFLSFRTPGQISIHPRPPHGGRPFPTPAATRHHPHFYPRPLHGGRQGNFSLSALPDRFLSTHALLTEGDTPWPRRTSDRRHFYPHPPHGGRPGNDALKYAAMKFLPTSSTRRATRTPAACPDGRSKFLPTPSTRRATLQPRH